MAEQMTGTMTFIAARSLLHVRQALRKPFPGLTLARMTPVDDSTLSYVITVDIEGTDYIFRFPLNGATAYLFPKEEKVLKNLTGCMAFPIPEIEYTWRTPVFTGYRKIAGSTAIEAKIKDMPPAARERFFQDIARFLASLHGQDVVDFDFLPSDPGSAIARGIEESLDKIGRQDPSGFVRRFAEQALAEFKDMLLPSNTPVLLHNDFQGKNIIYDDATNACAGVIDFTNTQTGDPHWDFRFIPIFGKGALAAVAAAYRNLTGREIDESAVECLHRLQLCRSLTLATEGHPRSADLVERIKRYQKLSR